MGDNCRILCCVVLCCVVVSCRVVSCRVVSCRVVSCRVVSCRVVMGGRVVSEFCCLVSRCTEAVCLLPSSAPSLASSSSSSMLEDTVRYAYYIGFSSTNEFIPKTQTGADIFILILNCIIFFSVCLDEDCFRNERDNNLLAFVIKYLE